MDVNKKAPRTTLTFLERLQPVNMKVQMLSHNFEKDTESMLKGKFISATVDATGKERYFRQAKLKNPSKAKTLQ